MLHEIYPMKYRVEYEDREPAAEDTVFLFDGESVCCRFERSEALFPKFGEISHDPGVKCRYLFSIDDTRYFMPDGPFGKDVTVPDGYVLQDCGVFRTARPRHQAFAVITAQELRGWYASRLFCGRCGAKTGHGDKERSCVCPECGQTEYPKLSPVVIVGVTDGERLLATRYKDRPYRRYALVAGYCEIGESFEDTVRREVFEETGVCVKNIKYYKSQPWGFSSTLLAGFFCELNGDPAISVDKAELDEAIWLSREEIPPADNDIALTAEMMEMFRTGRV